MAALNRVELIGNLGADPEVRSTASGEAVANIRLATTDTWKDKNTGEQKEYTEWHRLVLYRRLAEIARDYLKKGAQVYVEGRIRTRKWTDKDNQERYTTEIEVTGLKMLGKREGGAGQAQAQASTPVAATTAPAPADIDDDIPF